MTDPMARHELSNLVQHATVIGGIIDHAVRRDRDEAARQGPHVHVVYFVETVDAGER